MIYQFKITLKDINPPIWRSALMNPTMTMEELHFVTQSLMGWDCEQSYHFSSGKRRIVDPEDDGDEDDEFSSDVLIGQAFRKAGDMWTYLYDFEDNWIHEIVLEKIVELDPSVEYPVCIDGARACPPEESGGPLGYQNVLLVLKNPSDPQYKETIEWLTDAYDPEYFDKADVNEELHNPDNWVDDEDEDLDFEEEDANDGE
jgi:Plasmid pRiA4b ORF-3-like protein